MDESSYIDGRRRAYLDIISQCLRALDVDDPEAGQSRWILERQASVAALREICEAHGDNNWPDDLYLPDVIDKHLARYLGR